MAVLLRLQGHEVCVAYDGPQALELAAARQPAAVFLDIGLPGMDGYEVCRRLRQGVLAQALIVAITGYGQQEDRQRSQEAGFDAHQVKPVDLSALQALLEPCIAAAEERAGGPGTSPQAPLDPSRWNGTTRQAAPTSY
jgi:CheY-like chemotaxis protein